MEIAKLRSSLLMPSVWPSLCLLPRTAWLLYTFKRVAQTGGYGKPITTRAPPTHLVQSFAFIVPCVPAFLDWAPEVICQRESESHSVMSDSLQPHGLSSTRQEYWGGLPFPPPGDLPDSGIEPGPPALQADSLPSESPGKPMTGHFQGPQDPTPRPPREASGLLLLISGLYQAFPVSWPSSSAPIWCLWPFKTFLPQHRGLCILHFCWSPFPMRWELLQAGDHISFAFPSSACQSASTETGLKRGALKGREPSTGWDGGQKGIT